MREEQQYGELVEEAGDGEDHRVRRPGAAPDRAYEQQCRAGRAGRDHRVRPALLGIVADHRGDRVQQTGPEADARARQTGAERRDEAGGRGGGEDGREPQEDLAGVEGEDGAHKEVVQAVYGVDLVQQLPDLRHGAPRDLEGGRLVTPYASPVEPPAADHQHDGHGDRGDRDGGCLLCPSPCSSTCRSRA